VCVGDGICSHQELTTNHDRLTLLALALLKGLLNKHKKWCNNAQLIIFRCSLYIVSTVSKWCVNFVRQSVSVLLNHETESSECSSCSGDGEQRWMCPIKKHTSCRRSQVRAISGERRNGGNWLRFIGHSLAASSSSRSQDPFASHWLRDGCSDCWQAAGITRTDSTRLSGCYRLLDSLSLVILVISRTTRC